MVSEKLALYGSTALSGLEHLTLLVGNEEIASALIRHFGSIRATVDWAAHCMNESRIQYVPLPGGNIFLPLEERVLFMARSVSGLKSLANRNGPLTNDSHQHSGAVEAFE
jgi:hypothetical protein